MNINHRPWFRPRLIRRRGRHIILAGFCCAGKTSVLKPLADCLGMTSLDIDKQVEQVFGIPTATIIETRGIAVFRHAEIEILRSLPSTPILISTGSGTPARWLTLLRLLRLGTLVWLDVPFEELYRRMQLVATQEQHWPHIPFGAMPTVSRLKRSWYNRCQYYRQADVWVHNFGGATPTTVAADTAAFIRGI